MVASSGREDSAQDGSFRDQRTGCPLKPRLAIVHDWLVKRAGSDRVFENFAEMFPDASLFATLFWPPGFEGSILTRVRIRTSPLQRFPKSHELYPYYLPFMPMAVRSHNLEPFDVILSSSHAVAKGIRVRPGQLHICYCYTPARYLWDMQEAYLSSTRAAWLARPLFGAMRRWDVRTSEGVHHFVAISNFIRDRIRRVYGRDADVIHPPCDVEGLPLVEKKKDYFVTVSRLVPYKRVDLLVRAFNRLKLPLVVVGDGPGLGALRKLAGPTVRLTGWVCEEERTSLVADARAFVFAAEEDFGIAPVEAQACGTPVVGLGRGGLLDTVDPSRPTGILFFEQTEEAVVDAVERFLKVETDFRPSALRGHAQKFSTEAFRRAFGTYLEGKIAEFRRGYR